MTENVKTSIFANARTAADFAVEQWMSACTESVETGGYFAAALSGGRTPVDFYTTLSVRGKALPWEKIHIFLADERFVPADDDESNFRLIREHLLDHVHIPKDHVHRIETEAAPFTIAAVQYDEEIQQFFGINGDGIPEFDLIVLGIGEDGHTASLFPGTPALKEERRIAIPVLAEKPPHKRVSLTLPVLSSARRVLFLVTGSDKAGIVREVVEHGESRLPASLVRRKAEKVYLVMDGGAASYLSDTRT